MGFSDNMLHMETSEGASGSRLKGSLRNVPSERGKILVVRDFPPGCGRLAVLMAKPSEQSQVQVVSDPDMTDEIESEREVELDMHLEDEISGLNKDLPQEDVGPSEEEEVRTSGVKTHSSESCLENASARQCQSRRGVNFVRDFPPFCGRNAPRLNEEELMKWLTSLQNRGFNLAKFVINNEEKLQGKQVTEDVQDVDALQEKVEGATSKLPADEIRSDPKELASGKMRKQGAYQASFTYGTKVDKEDVGERSIKTPRETFPNEFHSNIETVTSRGLEGNPICDMVVYEEARTSEKRLSGLSASEDQLLQQYCGHEQVLLHCSCVQGLMPSSSTHPLQHWCVTCKLDMAAPSIKKRRNDDFIFLPRAKTALIANKNDAKSSGTGTRAKRISSLKIRASQAVDRVAIWDDEDSLQHDGHHIAQRSYDVNLTPSSTNFDNDVIATSRSKVRETLRLFHAIFRKLLQEQESKLISGEEKTHKRLYHQAAHILKRKGKYVNTGKQIIGPVPGVEVGDEFQYFVELNIVGLHRLSIGGIDYLKEGYYCGKPVGRIATSVVACEGYEDDLEYSDVLIYKGQGGNSKLNGKLPEDQEMKRGNLALANSRMVRNPVRVIRSEMGFSDGLERTGKSYSKTYVYDGLYLVEEVNQERGPNGKLVYKFKLVRIPGQPELAWKVLKKTNKPKAREGLCAVDISDRKEKIPIRAVNTIDSEIPPPFQYVCQVIYPKWCHPVPPKGCDCIIGCSEAGNCSCARKNGGQLPYNHDAAIVEAKPVVYECGPNCRCPPSCYNRVSQHGIRIQLEIFKAESRGWGVRSRRSIPAGSFICEYAGELLEEREAEERRGNNEYLFDIGNNYIDSSLWDSLSTEMPDARSSFRPPVVPDCGFTIDAARYGNIGRFINHSCSPNLYAQNVLYDHDDERIPHIMLFAAENIPPLRELAYNYHYMMDQVFDEDGNIKKKRCFCGSSDCTGWLY